MGLQGRMLRVFMSRVHSFCIQSVVCVDSLTIASPFRSHLCLRFCYLYRFSFYSSSLYLCTVFVIQSYLITRTLHGLIQSHRGRGSRIRRRLWMRLRLEVSKFSISRVIAGFQVGRSRSTRCGMWKLWTLGGFV